MQEPVVIAELPGLDTKEDALAWLETMLDKHKKSQVKFFRFCYRPDAGALLELWKVAPGNDWSILGEFRWSSPPTGEVPQENVEMAGYI